MSANFSLVLFVTTGFITIAGGTTIVLDPYDGLVDACNHNDPSYLICNIIIRILPAGARYLKKGLVITTLVKKISKSMKMLKLCYQISFSISFIQPAALGLLLAEGAPTMGWGSGGQWRRTFFLRNGMSHNRSEGAKSTVSLSATKGS